MAKTTGQQSVVCYHCGRRFDTGEHTQSTSCPQCHKRVVIEDVTVSTHKSVTRIQTCGHVVIAPTGRVIAKLVQGQKGVDVQGTVEAAVVSAGLVNVGPKARWKGDCQARALRVMNGAKLFGLFAIAGAAGLEAEPPEPAQPEAADDDLDATPEPEADAPAGHAATNAGPTAAAPQAPDAVPPPGVPPPPPAPTKPPRYDLIRGRGRT